MGSKLRTVSWVLLALVGVLVLLGSLASASLAYRGDFPIGGVSIAEVASGREAVLAGPARRARHRRRVGRGVGGPLPGRRLRSLPPGRRRDVVGHPRLGHRPRRGGGGPRAVPPGSQAGTGAPLVLLVVVLVALLLDVKRLRAPR